MTIRTTKTTVTFRKPFTLGAGAVPLPAGVYIVETDEERLEGLSFPAYRRILTVISLQPGPGISALTRALTVDPDELAAALQRDAAAKAALG